MTEEEKLLFRVRAEELFSNSDASRHHNMFSMMEPTLAACEPEEYSITLGFPGLAWEQNPNGVIHGGITAAMMDIGMGMLTYALTGAITPTINLNISYPRPAVGNGRFLLRAELVKSGRSAIYTTAALCEENHPGKPVVAAQGVFFNPTGKFLGES